MSDSRFHSLLPRAAGLFAICLTLASCSSGSSEGKREYAVPSSLCGTAVSSSALAPLLPAGKKITSVKSGPSGLTRCRLVVDGQVAVTSIIEQWESGTTLRNVAYGTYGLTSANIKKEGPKYIVSDSKAVGHVSCSKPEKADHEVFTMIRKEHGTIDATTMEKVITEFTDAASTAKECAGPST